MGGIVDKHAKNYRDVEDVELSVPRYKPEGLQELCDRTNFNKREIQLMYRGFKQECPSGTVEKERFKDIYHQYFPEGKSSHYASYLFKTFDQSNSGTLSFEDFLCGVSTLSRGSLEDKLQWAFNLYDINHDGRISRDEMHHIVSSVYDLRGKELLPLNLIGYEQCISHHVDFVFKKMDINNDGVITMDEFVNTCTQDDTIIRSMIFLDTTFH